MKHFDICGVGNGIVDLLVTVSEEDLAALQLKKGSMSLIDAAGQRKLIDALKGHECVVVGGGSIANSLSAFAQLGGKAAFHTCLGDDKYGFFYKAEFDSLGIELGTQAVKDGVTGTCLSMIAPDGERTMRTHLGVASHMSARHISREIIGNSRWLLLEGFMFSGGDDALSAVEAAVSIAESCACKIAVTFSDLFVVNNFRKQLEQWVPYADLVVANEFEAMAFTGKKTLDDALRVLVSGNCSAVVTASERGVKGRINGEDFSCPAFPCSPIDLTGAGDMFLGAFLYGMVSGMTMRDTARGACYLAMKVITQVGARLHSGVREFWQEGMEAGA